MWLRRPIKAHILSILKNGLEDLIEAVEERQPVVEVALETRRLLLAYLANYRCMRDRKQQRHVNCRLDDSER